MKRYIFVSLIVFVIAIVLLIVKQQSFLSQKGNQPAIQSHRSYSTKLVSAPNLITSNQPTPLKFLIQNERSETLKDFAVAHEKLMHLIIIRKDLAHFQHLHPTFDDKTGEFSVSITFPENGEYQLFADFTPAKEADNPMLLPIAASFDVTAGDGKYSMQPIILDATNQKSVEGYEITYLFPTSDNLISGSEITYSLLVEKNGQPVADLENYLGAKGHSVIIKEGTLEYIHTHALDGEQKLEENIHGSEHVRQQERAMQQENQIDFSTIFPFAGKYKIFTQFQHQQKVLTTEYVVNVNKL